jgi:DNA-binding response OmpR family regulator
MNPATPAGRDLMDRLQAARLGLHAQSERLRSLMAACRATTEELTAARDGRRTTVIGRLFAGEVVPLGEVEVVMARQAIRHRHTMRRLTPTEWQLLLYLLANPDTVHSRADLAAGAWGAGYHGRDSEVEVYVSRLRRKLAPADRLLETVRGRGYRLIVAGDEGDLLEAAIAREAAIA